MLVTVYWFTYGPDGGRQAWMVGTGVVVDGVVTVDEIEPLFLPTGGVFGPTFDPNTVVLTPWGPVIFVFNGCGGGTMSYMGPTEFGSGEYAFSRIADIDGVECRLVAPGSAARHVSNKAFTGPGISGSWFDPTHAGEGWIIEILPGGGVVMAWFTYDSAGEQVWLVGAAGPEAFDGKTITLTDVQITSGPVFGPGFDGDSVERIRWGTATFEFDGCNFGTMTYASVLPEFGSGSLDLERLTALADTDCTE